MIVETITVWPSQEFFDSAMLTFNQDQSQLQGTNLSSVAEADGTITRITQWTEEHADLAMAWNLANGALSSVIYTPPATE
jgi:hypothetical protein